MAELDHSAEDSNNSIDSKEKHSREDMKLQFSEDEETLILRMYNLVGQRWSLIAGRIPGRTSEEIEKYWTSKKLQHPMTTCVRSRNMNRKRGIFEIV